MFEDIIESPLGKSLERHVSSGDLHSVKPKHIFDLNSLVFPEPGLTTLREGTDAASLKLAQLAIMHDHSYSSWLMLIDAFETCQSPIERLFLSALIAVAADDSHEIVLYAEKHRFDLSPPTWPKLHIQPQCVIGDYKVDFLLLWESARNSSQEQQAPTVSPFPKTQSSLVVECDGHDFHEKTKDQTSRDKERDRTLQSCGFHVFRYSGSDIYRDPIKCAIECREFLVEQMWRK